MFNYCADCWLLLRPPGRVHFFVATKKRTKESAYQSSVKPMLIGFADSFGTSLCLTLTGSLAAVLGVFLPLRLAHKNSAKLSGGIENLSSVAGEHVSGIRIRPDRGEAGSRAAKPGQGWPVFAPRILFARATNPQGGSRRLAPKSVFLLRSLPLRAKNEGARGSATRTIYTLGNRAKNSRTQRQLSTISSYFGYR